MTHTVDIAEKSVCSSISEPLAAVIPDETSGFAERFCGLLRTELRHHAGEAREALSSFGAPGDSGSSSSRSCDFIAQDGATTISARAVYMLQPDQSTRLLVIVSAW